MGLWGEWGISLCSDELCGEYGLPNLLPLQNEMGRLLLRKNKYLLLGAAEEVTATITVGVLFVLSTPNAMRYAHRPNHGALL